MAYNFSAVWSNIGIGWSIEGFRILNYLDQNVIIVNHLSIPRVLMLGRCWRRYLPLMGRTSNQLWQGKDDAN